MDTVLLRFVIFLIAVSLTTITGSDGLLPLISNVNAARTLSSQAVSLRADTVNNFITGLTESPLLDHSIVSPPDDSGPSQEDYNTTMSPNKHEKDAWEFVLWTLPYCLVIAAGFGGNFIVIWIVLTQRAMRTVTNYFILNMSISDVMYALLNIGWYYSANINGKWYFARDEDDHLFCKIVRFVAPLTTAASIFSLMAISIDRYLAIVEPLSHQLTKFRAWLTIVTIWSLAIILNVPQLMFATVEKIQTPTDDFYACSIYWFEEEEPYGKYFVLAKVAYMITFFVIPLIAIGYSYTVVSVKLWGNLAIGESINERQLKSKRKVVKMMIMVVIVFTITMLPQHIFLLSIGIDSSILNNDHISRIWLALVLLANSNVIYNPIIYCWMNNRFRNGFINFFRGLVCKERIELTKTIKFGNQTGLPGDRVMYRSNLHTTTTKPRGVRAIGMTHQRPDLLGNQANETIPSAGPKLLSDMSVTQVSVVVPEMKNKNGDVPHPLETPVVIHSDNNVEVTEAQATPNDMNQETSTIDPEPSMAVESSETTGERKTDETESHRVELITVDNCKSNACETDTLLDSKVVSFGVDISGDKQALITGTEESEDYNGL